MAGDRELRIRIVGDSTSGEKALLKTAAAADKVAPKATIASKALADVKTQVLSLIPGGNAANTALTKMSAGAAETGGAMSGALAGGVAAAGVALAGMTVQGVQQYVALASAGRAYQRVVGGTAESASAMVVAFRSLGVDQDAAAKGMFKLSREVESGNAALGAYGVQVAHNKNGTTDLQGTLLNVVDAYNATDDAAKRNAIAFAAFGRAGLNLAPILAKGRDGLKELWQAAADHGEIMSQDDFNKAKEFKLATHDLGEAVKGFEIELAKGLVPALTTATDELAGFIDAANKATKPLGGISGAIGGVLGSAQQFLGVRPIMDALHGDFGKVAGDTVGLGAAIDVAHGHYRQALGNIIPMLGEHKKATKDTATETKALGDAEAEAATHADGFAKATEDLTKSQRSLQTAHRSTESAQRSESSAREDLNKLLAAGKVNADDVERAEKGVASAARSTADAQKAEAASTKGVATAQQSLAEAQANLDKVKGGSNPRDIKKAELDLAASKRAQERAILGLADANDKAAQSQGIGVQSSGDLLKNNLDLADAQDQVASTALSTQDAQDRLTQLQQAGKDGSKELKDAQDLLAQKTDELNKAIEDQAAAHENVATQQQAQIEASDALRKAQEGDPDFAEKLRDAQQKVADAHQNTADQVLAERDAVDALNKSEATLSVERRARQDTQDAALAGYQAETSALDGRGGTAGPGTGVTVTVPLHIDGREVARATVHHTADELAKLAKRAGVS